MKLVVTVYERSAEAAIAAIRMLDAPHDMVELRVDTIDGFEVGQEITVESLPAGTRVDVTGISRGKGFAGGMKPHTFSGPGASHRNHNTRHAKQLEDA